MKNKLWKFLESLRRPEAQRGMTLIEIMVVIVIIGVLGSALAYGVFGMLADAKQDATKAQVANVYNVVHLVQQKNGDLPDSLAALSEGKHPKLEKQNLKDAWKQDLTFTAEGEEFKICSNGPDKRSGTEDDICYPTDQK